MINYLLSGGGLLIIVVGYILRYRMQGVIDARQKILNEDIHAPYMKRYVRMRENRREYRTSLRGVWKKAPKLKVLQPLENQRFKAYMRQRRALTAGLSLIIIVYVASVGSVHLWMGDIIPIMIDFLIVVGGWIWSNHFTRWFSAAALFMIVGVSVAYTPTSSNMVAALALGYDTSEVLEQATGQSAQIERSGALILTGQTQNDAQGLTYDAGVFYDEQGRQYTVLVPQGGAKEQGGVFKGRLSLSPDTGYVVYVGEVILDGTK